MASPMPPRGSGPNSRRNFLLIGGIAVAAIGAYYLYGSNGDVKSAAKRAEADAKIAQAKGFKEAEKLGDKIDKGYDDLVAVSKEKYGEVRKDLDKEWSKAEAKRQEAGKRVGGLVDRLDAEADKAAGVAKDKISKAFGKS